VEHELNTWLAEYGKVNDNVRYRLVWSNSIMEHRYGYFRRYSDSGIYLGEEWGTQLARKYNYIHDRWIFEAFSPAAQSSEVPGTVGKGDYVPVYVFNSSTDESLPVTRKILEFLIGCVNGRVDKDNLPSREYTDFKEIQAMEESMDDHPSDFSTRPGPQRNAIAYDKGLKNAK